MLNEIIIHEKKNLSQKPNFFLNIHNLMIYSIVLFIGIFAILIFISGEVEGKSIIVDETIGHYKNIQDAVNGADEKDIIYIYDGIYNENVLVNKTLTIIGNGSSKTTINGLGIGNTIKISENYVNLSEVEVTNSGGESNNAGILIENNIGSNILNVKCISNNNFGIFLNNSDTILKNCEINDNMGNGIYVKLDENCKNFAPKFENLIVDNNKGFGIEIFANIDVETNFDVKCYYYPNIINSKFSNNSDYGIYINNFAKNGIYWWDAISDVFITIEDSEITKCKGGILTNLENGYNGNANIFLSLIDSDIYNNTNYGVCLQDTGIKEEDSNVFLNGLFDWYGNGYSWGNWTFYKKSSYNFIDSVEIKNGNLLNIEPGSIITFGGENTKLSIQGEIKAIGLENDKIIFTSNKIPQQTGQWYGLHFNNISENENSIIQNTEILYAKIGVESINSNPLLMDLNIKFCSNYGMKLINYNGTIMNSTIKDNTGTGILIIFNKESNNLSPILERLNIQNNNGYGAEVFANIDIDIYSNELYSYSPYISNSKFTLNLDYGINVYSYAKNNNYFRNAISNLLPIIDNCTITECLGGIIGTQSNDFNGKSYVNLSLFDNDIFNNSEYGIYMQNLGIFEKDTNIYENQQADWQGYGYSYGDWNWYEKSKYNFTGNIIIKNGDLLTIEPGTRISFVGQESKLIIKGIINATGIENKKINFMSTLGNLEKGQWYGIYFDESLEECILNNVIIQYAINGIECYLSKPKLRYILIQDCLENGLKMCSINGLILSEIEIKNSNIGVITEDCQNVDFYNTNIRNNNYGYWSVNSDISIINSTLDNILYDIYLKSISNIVFINTTFDSDKIIFDDDESEIFRKWFLNIYVMDKEGYSISQANVKIIDNKNNESDFITDQNGGVKWINYTEYSQTVSGKKIFTPITISTQKDEYFNETKYNINESEIISIFINELVQFAIYDIETQPVDGYTMILKWKTSTPSKSQIEYGTSVVYDKITEKNNKFEYEHNITLMDLDSNTTYHFRIISENSEENITKSIDYNFKTPFEFVPNITIELEFDKLEPKEGEEVKITTRLLNNADYNANITLLIYDTIDLIKTEILNIEPLKSSEINHIWTAQGAREHKIEIIIKHKNKQIANFSKSLIVKGQSVQDLDIEMIIDFGATKPRDGDTVEISVSISNNGDSGIVADFILLDNGIKIDSETGIPIFAKRDQGVLFNWKVNGKGTHNLNIIVMVDGQEVKNESRVRNVKGYDEDDSICPIAFVIPLVFIGAVGLISGKKVKKE